MNFGIGVRSRVTRNFGNFFLRIRLLTYNLLTYNCNILVIRASDYFIAIYCSVEIKYFVFLSSAINNYIFQLDAINNFNNCKLLQSPLGYIENIIKLIKKLLMLKKSEETDSTGLLTSSQKFAWMSS